MRRDDFGRHRHDDPHLSPPTRLSLEGSLILDKLSFASQGGRYRLLPSHLNAPQEDSYST
jgi:hypothetical protein